MFCERASKLTTQLAHGCDPVPVFQRKIQQEIDLSARSIGRPLHLTLCFRQRLQAVEALGPFFSAGIVLEKYKLDYQEAGVEIRFVYASLEAKLAYWKRLGPNAGQLLFVQAPIIPPNRIEA
jgi:hypothetical protein